MNLANKKKTDHTLLIRKKENNGKCNKMNKYCCKKQVLHFYNITKFINEVPTTNIALSVATMIGTFFSAGKIFHTHIYSCFVPNYRFMYM